MLFGLVWWFACFMFCFDLFCFILLWSGLIFFIGQISSDISDTLISGFSRLKRPDLLMTTLFPKHFLYCRIQCYTHNLPESNWGGHHFLLLYPLYPAAKDHQTLQAKDPQKNMAQNIQYFICILQSLHDYWNKKVFLVNWGKICLAGLEPSC